MLLRAHPAKVDDQLPIALSITVCSCQTCPCRHDHWYYDLAPKINRKAWDFLKQHELPGEPRFQVYQR